MKFSCMTRRVTVTIVASFTIVSSAYAGIEQFVVTNAGIDLAQQAVFLHVDHAAASSTCPDRTAFKWLLSTNGARDVIAIALSAMATGKRVTIGVYDGNVCINGNATAAWVRLDE